MGDAGPFPLVGGYEIANWFRSRALEIGASALPYLLVVAERGSVELRATALLVMAEIDPNGTEHFVLERARRERSSEVREAATRALARSRGDAALSFLCETDQDRAARIALRERLALLSTNELLAVVEGAGDRPLLDRKASICLERLVGMRALPDDFAFRIVHAHLAAPLNEELDTLEQMTLDGEAIDILIHTNPVRVLEELAHVVQGGRPAQLGALLRFLECQLDLAWTDEARGFDDHDPPAGLVPDPGWSDLLDGVRVHEDLVTTVGVGEVRDALEWTYLPRINRSLRRIESGAEQGAAFVLAGFDVGARRLEVDEVVRALDGLGGRAKTNLHLVTHQCGGTGCSHYTILGIPLGTRALQAHFGPGAPGSDGMLDLLEGWREADPHTLGDVLERLLPYVPGLPKLVGGTEALVWTAPTRLGEALRDLDVVRILPASRPWREESGFYVSPYDVLRPIGRFQEEHEALLLEVGRRLGFGRPNVFVLWTNSD